MIRRKIKGFNLNIIHTVLTVLMAIVFCFILIISGNVQKKYRTVQESLSKFLACEQSSKAILESSDFLTEQARLFVLKSNIESAKAYSHEIADTKTQEKALNKLLKVCSDKDLAFQRLKIAITQAESLINMELYAMRLSYEANKNLFEDDLIPSEIKQINIKPSDLKLSKEDMKKEAIENLFGDGYLIYKTRIYENCKLTVNSIEKQIEDALGISSQELGRNLTKLQFLFCFLLGINVFTIISIIFLIQIPLKSFGKSIKKDEKLNIIGATELKKVAVAYNEIYENIQNNNNTLLIKPEYDILTGLLNRHSFDLVCEISSEKKISIALLLIDVDNFKQVNETYGHNNGDKALREIGLILLDTFRKDDYVARLDGDNFAAVLKDFKIESADRIVEKISVINEKLSEIKDTKGLSISVGAAYSEVGFTEEIYKKADKALYSVKENGKRGCRVYSD